MTRKLIKTLSDHMKSLNEHINNNTNCFFISVGLKLLHEKNMAKLMEDSLSLSELEKRELYTIDKFMKGGELLAKETMNCARLINAIHELLINELTLYRDYGKDYLYHVFEEYEIKEIYTYSVIKMSNNIITNLTNGILPLKEACENYERELISNSGPELTNIFVKRFLEFEDSNKKIKGYISETQLTLEKIKESLSLRGQERQGRE